MPIDTRAGQDPANERIVIVVDASVLANAVRNVYAEGSVARIELRAAIEFTAPALADGEPVSVLRKRRLAGTIADNGFEAAVTRLHEIAFSTRTLA